MPVLSGGATKIDGELRAVIAHQEHVKPPAIEDLTAAVAKLEGRGGAAGRGVSCKSFETEKNQGQVLNRKFDELLKQAGKRIRSLGRSLASSISIRRVSVDAGVAEWLDLQASDMPREVADSCR